MSDAFSTPAAHAFEHPELDPSTLEAVAGPSSMGDALTDVPLEEAYEVEDTILRIISGGYKTIGLQFPDELLPSSVQVFKAIQKRIQHTGAQAYVLADSTYGSCCPDVLSCLHLPADFLVHYGHACLTPTDAIPVHYVFPRRRLDVASAAASLLEASKADLETAGRQRGVIVVWDVAFDWLADDIVSTLIKTITQPISFASIRRSTASPPTTERAQEKAPALRTIEPPSGIDLADCTIWYIGEEGRSLINIQMTHASNPLYVYSPAENTTTPLHPKTSRLLSRRLFALHSAMASDIFGLIVGNVGLASSRPLLQQLRQELRKAKKKSYTLSVGRLNPAKLANFETIECFVMVGCAEGGVVDSKDFLRPIITPWELLLALKGSEGVWDPSQWTLDMAKVLDAARADADQTDGTPDGGDSHPDGAEDSDEAPEFSLVTGTYRTRKVFHNGQSQSSSTAGPTGDMAALTLRNSDFTLAKLESAGSTYLNSREFKGLEVRYGMDEPAELEEGRRGIARDYAEER